LDTLASSSSNFPVSSVKVYGVQGKITRSAASWRKNCGETVRGRHPGHRSFAGGAKAAWFKDSEGNIMAVTQRL
jgi:hypothetical protein